MTDSAPLSGTTGVPSPPASVPSVHVDINTNGMCIKCGAEGLWNVLWQWAVGGGGWRWSVSRLSSSTCLRLTVNGIFLLSHSIGSPFSRLLFHCPSEAFSIGLLNPAPPPVWTCAAPQTAFTSSVPSESSLQWRQGTMTYFILRNVHAAPPPSIAPLTPNNPPLTPNFPNLDKMRIPQSH